MEPDFYDGDRVYVSVPLSGILFLNDLYLDPKDKCFYTVSVPLSGILFLNGDLPVLGAHPSYCFRPLIGDTFPQPKVPGT